MAPAREIPIDEKFFCDGPTAVLLSRSRGGTEMDPQALAETIGAAEPKAIRDLLERGVCLPIDFATDCALDGATLFVVGALDAAHAEAWRYRLTSRLHIPCGQLVLLAGGAIGDELERAVSGQPPDEDYSIYQTIEVPPGDYRVDVLALPGSPTVALLDDEEADEEPELSYVIHLTPIAPGTPVPLPRLDPDSGWPGLFEPRA